MYPVLSPVFSSDRESDGDRRRPLRCDPVLPDAFRCGFDPVCAGLPGLLSVPRGSRRQGRARGACAPCSASRLRRALTAALPRGVALARGQSRPEPGESQ